MVKNLISSVVLVMTLGFFTYRYLPVFIPVSAGEADLLIANGINQSFASSANQTRPLNQILLDKTRLLASAKAGGDYLVRMQKADVAIRLRQCDRLGRR